MKILITHGTDTIVETAKYLAKKNITGKTIVLTGAMVPIAFGTSSDGLVISSRYSRRKNVICCISRLNT